MAIRTIENKFDLSINLELYKLEYSLEEAKDMVENDKYILETIDKIKELDKLSNKLEYFENTIYKIGEALKATNKIDGKNDENK